MGFTGDESGDDLRSEVKKLRADAAEGVVRELEAHDERLYGLEDWRTRSMVEGAGRDARADERDRRLALLEAALARYNEDKLNNEKFQERVRVWGTVFMLIWPIIVVVIGKFLK